MGFSCGLVGLPNAGKSTLFNALSNAGARVESYPFCTIGANIGTVAVPDLRLDRLATVFPDKRKVPTHLEFVDIAGLVEHAANGEGMGNQFLSEIRTVDAILHVVRCFEDANVAHVTGSIDAARDIGIVETELLLKDLETLSRVAKRLRQETKGKDRTAGARLAAWEALLEQVSAGIPIRTRPVNHVIDALVAETSPLTAKPMLFVANVGDEGDCEHLSAIERIANDQGSRVVAIRGRLEAEVGEIATSPEERVSYLGQYGMTETGLDLLVRAGYDLLHLITFYTFEGPEVRAWTVPTGTVAPAAGGKIHSDFADRFVLAEVMALDELVDAGSEKPLRDAGHIRRAGRDYVVADGDVIHFVCS
ncbi:redox-regulated ATPase YchF [Candidatus Bipolaricaulota bacterium]|nr:redox-regulated ATPase YchF [Candidatus Bipolaricaulota bacterium]